MHPGEPLILVSRLSLVFLLSYVLRLALGPNSRFPLLVGTFLAASTISQSPMLVRAKQKLVGAVLGEKTLLEGSNSDSRTQLVSSVSEIRQYLGRSKAWNDRKRSLYKTMSWRQQKIVAETGYTAKSLKIDQLLAVNNQLIKDLTETAMKKYGISTLELKAAADKARLRQRSEHYRVIESLCHFARDWTPASYEAELLPIVAYIRKSLEGIDCSNTVAVVPGSGLGRIAHELATSFDFRQVFSVEYSWLMVLFNEFVYGGSKKYRIHPHVHNYSNHLTTANQLRSILFEQVPQQPENLKILRQDFNSFSVREESIEPVPENLVIVTCFFLDTAENLMDYMDSLERIASEFTGKVTWINVGPLKYGTAAKVELNYEELKELRGLMGWKTVDEGEKPVLLGYLTDKESLWQGYYGVGMWTCERMTNDE